MKDNNTTPAMKEVEKVLEEAEQHANQVTNGYGTGSNIIFSTFKSRAKNSYILGYEAGAKWREENPLPPTPKEDKEQVRVDDVVKLLKDKINTINCLKIPFHELINQILSLNN
jgi:hypothetical protein